MKESGISGWGRTFVPGREVRSEDFEQLALRASLSRGLGRSYGDASLPAPDAAWVAGSTLADRILRFDETTGVLRAESGLSLVAMKRIFLRRGFFTPVTPGTKYVTLGGMVASDVHGKNHHVAGTIGRHVRALKLRCGNGQTLECSREHHADLFFATLGGMGLTGHILEVELTLERVPSPWIYQESSRIADLQSFLTALKEAGQRWPFTVGWLDTLAAGRSLGRGILYCGRWAEPHEAPAHAPAERRAIRMPFMLPSGVVNRASIGLFNTLLYHRQPRRKLSVVDSDLFFYPLDRILRWNLLYGPHGVTQHQCVLPERSAVAGITAMIRLLRELSAVSFLSVVKDCGAEGEGVLSFPRPGMSLALDIPIHQHTRQVISRLNELVIAHEGRIYLAKDGLTEPAQLRAMDPRVDRFLELRKRWDPQGRIRSAQSQRLFGS